MRQFIVSCLIIFSLLWLSGCPTPIAEPANTDNPAVGTPTPTPTAGSPKLLINEIDYDQASTDPAEFIEIYNAGAATSLSGYSIVLVNGATNSVYTTIDLTPVGSIAAGQYLVIGSDSALAYVATGSLKLSLGAGQDYIQNGSPDGLALVKTSPNTLVDALS